MSKKKELITNLSEAIDKIRLENYEIVQIDLTPTSHKILTDDLEASSQEDVFHIEEFMDIPVVVTSSIPNDKMWVIRKKSKQKVEEERRSE